jgi:hypothetical protein
MSAPGSLTSEEPSRGNGESRTTDIEDVGGTTPPHPNEEIVARSDMVVSVHDRWQ